MTSVTMAPRTLGGTLILGSSPTTTATISITVIGRDGKVSGTGRDGTAIGRSRDAIAVGKGA